MLRNTFLDNLYRQSQVELGEHLHYFFLIASKWFSNEHFVALVTTSRFFSSAPEKTILSCKDFLSVNQWRKAMLPQPCVRALPVLHKQQQSLLGCHTCLQGTEKQLWRHHSLQPLCSWTPKCHQSGRWSICAEKCRLPHSPATSKQNRFCYMIHPLREESSWTRW